MSRILLTGGGSAGHVTPNLALIPRLQELGVDIQYIGREAGIERDLIEPLGIPYHAVKAGKLRRYLDLQNIIDLFRILRGFLAAISIIRKLRPDILFSKGGFVACPVVWAAWLNRVPVIIHESDLTPGLANTLSAPFAERICYSFPETAARLPVAKAVYTGIPIRPALLSGRADKGRSICNFTKEKPVVLVVGGSQGAVVINAAVRAALPELLKTFQVCHLCGKGNLDAELPKTSGYAQFEYVTDELSHLLAMTDVVVSRAGATTLFELLALKKPNLLIPLALSSSRGDQIANAGSFEKQGFSVVLPQEKLQTDTLINGITQTYTRRETFVEAMQMRGGLNGVDKVIELIRMFTC